VPSGNPGRTCRKVGLKGFSFFFARRTLLFALRTYVCTAAYVLQQQQQRIGNSAIPRTHGIGVALILKYWESFSQFAAAAASAAAAAAAVVQMKRRPMTEYKSCRLDCHACTPRDVDLKMRKAFYFQFVAIVDLQLCALSSAWAVKRAFSLSARALPQNNGLQFAVAHFCTHFWRKRD
jgi:hypothetical protein